ncbi:CLUMA_CG002261, isoform A [Clunio marinus]|uniref:CLUMA_CG002261, isoform A n=1 Tax=Clunio marinus TaxID=568069 RepID=A0A1J1HKB7_9DIPT|nr:CLUMA_CG002261, isoform A [Clunio marinus]
MIMIAGVDSYVSMETTVFGAGLGMCVLVVIFFLYMNRKWCFSHTSGSFPCCDEKSLSTKTIHSFRSSRYPYHENSSSDSEEEILRRLKLQQSISLQSGQIAKYGGFSSPLNQSINLDGFQPIPIDNVVSSSTKPIKYSSSRSSNFHRFNNANSKNRDLLGQAERGKIGSSHTSSECSSNSSVEASVESNMGLINHEKKDRRQIHPALERTAPLRDSKIERRNSGCKSLRSSIVQQDSLEDVPDINGSSNQDCIVDVQEPMFDTSDLKSLKSELDLNPQSPTASLLERGGSSSLEIALLYDAPMRKMTVHVLQARGIPTREKTTTHTQVRLLILPSKKQKHKTKIRSGENPQFMESFLLHRVNPEEVNSMGLRVRVYGCERMRRERLIGETIISFATIDLDLETNLWLPLEPRNSSVLSGSSSDLLSLARSDSTGSTTSMQHGGVPELLIALGYNGTTGRLTVEIVKGSQFRNLSLGKAPDTYVKLCLVSSMGQEIARSKTSTKRGQPNPLFKETFIFQVALFQLNDVTLMISVYAKRNMKRNEMVGWFSLGLNSSGPEEAQHFNDMRDAANINGQVGKCDLIARWHVLVRLSPRRNSLTNFMKRLSKDNNMNKKDDSCTVDILEDLLPGDDLNFV